MEKKNNKLLIILCIVFGFIALGFGGYFVYNQFIKDVNMSAIDLNKNCTTSEKQTECIRSLTLDDKKIEIKAIATSYEYNDRETLYEFQTLKINNNVVQIENGDTCNYHSLFFYNVYDSNGISDSFISINMWCDYSNGPTTIVVNQNGETLIKE